MMRHALGRRRRHGEHWFRVGNQVPKTPLGAAFSRGRHDQARAILRKAYALEGGNVGKTAARLRVSRSWLKVLTKELGMLDETSEMRRRYKTRFRLPPLGSAASSSGERGR